MWIKEYLFSLKSNIFVFIQICLALVLINGSIGYILYQTDQWNNMEKTDQDTYIYQYAMAATGMFDQVETDYEKCIQKIRSLPGIDKVGECFDPTCELNGDAGLEDSAPPIAYVMDSTVTSAVTYHVKKGRWLTETDRNADKIYAVLSGDMAGRYQVGDHLEVSLDPGGTYEVEVVGILPRNSAVFSTHGVLASQTQESLMQPCENTIFMNHVKVFEDVKSGGFGTPNVHCIVKLNDKADETELSKYGRLVSFAKMEQETKKQIREFIAEDLEECLLWGAIILFGVVATAYLVARKKRYVWAIYLMLGEKASRILKMQILHNGVTYLMAMGIAVILYQFYARKNVIMNPLSAAHVLIDFAFVVLMLVVNGFCSAYILKIEPKEILTQTKE